MILNFIECRVKDGIKKLNIGDYASAPCRYLKFDEEYEICSLRDVNDIFLSKYDKNTNIIIIFT